MKVSVVLEFDENDLGKQWLNPDNLALLLYSDCKTKKELLKIVSYGGIERCEIFNPAFSENKICHFFWLEKDEVGGDFKNKPV